MTNLVVTNLQATGEANELSNYSSLVGRVYPPMRREQFLLGAEAMAQQATINTVPPRASVRAAGPSAAAAIYLCFPPCKM